MKLYTFRVENKERLGALLRGHLVDLATAYDVMFEVRGRPSDALQRLPPTMLGLLRAGPAGLSAARKSVAFVSKRPAVPVGLRLTYAFDEVNLLAPLRPGKILMMAEGQSFFQKVTSAIIGTGGSIELPGLAGGIDADGYLAAVIGQRTKRISEAEAPNHIAGYSIMSDLSAPALSEPNRVSLGKNFDTFCPFGPCLVTPEEWRHSSEARCQQFVNERLVRVGSLLDSLPTVARAIAVLAEVMTLEPGDVVAVSLFKGTPMRLLPGEIAALEVDGIGRLENPCVSVNPIAVGR